ncbi:MAG TPA: hypothetical protein VMZ90_06580 [Vicinamibacterales bacterium]|nr:hypothetical protein [Vicinamibacterales bacterium]
MRTLRPVVVMTILLASLAAPRSAYAMAGWWDWLDAMSGPGPFSNGFMLDMRLACRIEKDQPTTQDDATWVPFKNLDCLTNSRKVKGYFEVRGGRVTTDEKPLFGDAPNEPKGRVAAHLVSGMFMRQFDPTFAVGTGVGWIWFSGTNVKGHPGRFAFTPVSLAFTPLKLFAPSSAKAGLIVIRAEEIAILGRMKATDFDPASKSSFNTNSDLVTSIAVTFDFGALR